MSYTCVWFGLTHCGHLEMWGYQTVNIITATRHLLILNLVLYIEEEDLIRIRRFNAHRMLVRMLLLLQSLSLRWTVVPWRWRALGDCDSAASRWHRWYETRSWTSARQRSERHQSVRGSQTCERPNFKIAFYDWILSINIDRDTQV